MEAYAVGDFQSQINESTGSIIILNGTEKLSFSTGEAPKAKEALRFSATLLSTSVLPNAIKFSPFTVRFKEDGGAVLARETGGVSFTSANWEDLMKLIEMSVHRIADQLKIRGGPRAGISSVRMPDPII